MIENKYPIRFRVDPNEKSDFKTAFLVDGYIVRLSVRAEMRIEGELRDKEPIIQPAKPLIVATCQEIDSQCFELTNDEFIGMICRKVYNDTLDALRKELKERYRVEVPQFENHSENAI
jgi:hypothetical protein